MSNTMSKDHEDCSYFSVHEMTIEESWVQAAFGHFASDWVGVQRWAFSMNSKTFTNMALLP